MIENRECVFILLAAGSGSRMKSKVAKQYMLLGDKPVLWYSLKAVEDSRYIDRCILAIGKDDISYVQEEIVAKYGFTKVDRIVAGGAQRYDSVYHALCTLQEAGTKADDLILIHDGARPFLTEEIIQRCCEETLRYRACAVGMPVKDTIKIADDNGFAAQTPDRSHMWQIQTPQVFQAALIMEAYEKLMAQEAAGQTNGIRITDDAMVVETFTETKVKLTEGAYENLKITTPEDIIVAEAVLKAKFVDKAGKTHE